ncbi:MAG: hypothetical protein QOJ96_721 [Alphaproteobacteria bacterium]|jgi:hypothetical protein|nr:hypothetical protein [Alphaproteobacteria bacterium]
MPGHLKPHAGKPLPSPTERPRCPGCGSRMNLGRAMPGPKGCDLRNFECDRCDTVLTRTVAVDPMKSAWVGWLAGELKPPE